ncbi:hypothetical protein A8B75_19660 [Sphingomonadales bacterium EhC05]|nr:hypothetical protein A8B75_19660 [Sphingomonadales bacterium EhC05]
MQFIEELFVQYWLELLVAIIGLLAAGIWFKKTRVTQGKKSNFVDQSHSKSSGDMVGRDKSGK